MAAPNDVWTVLRGLGTRAFNALNVRKTPLLFGAATFAGLAYLSGAHSNDGTAPCDAPLRKWIPSLRFDLVPPPFRALVYNAIEPITAYTSGRHRGERRAFRALGKAMNGYFHQYSKAAAAVETPDPHRPPFALANPESGYRAIEAVVDALYRVYRATRTPVLPVDEIEASREFFFGLTHLPAHDATAEAAAQLLQGLHALVYNASFSDATLATREWVAAHVLAVDPETRTFRRRLERLIDSD